MTQQQIAASNTYARALARADEKGVKVLEHIVIRCELFSYYDDWFKVLGSDGECIYVVQVVGRSLICDCKAAQQGTYCYHRAVCTRRLLDEAAQALGEIYGAFDNLISIEDDSDRDTWADSAEDRYLSEMDQFIAEMAG